MANQPPPVSIPPAERYGIPGRDLWSPWGGIYQTMRGDSWYLRKDGRWQLRSAAGEDLGTAADWWEAMRRLSVDH